MGRPGSASSDAGGGGDDASEEDKKGNFLCARPPVGTCIVHALTATVMVGVFAMSSRCSMMTTTDMSEQRAFQTSVFFCTIVRGIRSHSSSAVCTKNVHMYLHSHHSLTLYSSHCRLHVSNLAPTQFQCTQSIEETQKEDRCQEGGRGTASRGIESLTNLHETYCTWLFLGMGDVI